MAASIRANGKPSSRHEAPDAVWNVARCNRLLRPISSKIKTLRREADSVQASDTQDRPSDLRNRGGSGSRPPTSNRSTRTSIDDQDWAFYKPKQGIKRKYGNRSAWTNEVAKKEHARDEVESTPWQNGQINIPTPYIRKLFLGQQNSPLSAIKATKQAKDSQEGSKPKIVRLAKSKHLCSSTEGLGQAFEQVLIATKGATPVKFYDPAERKGTRSLFNVCLRNLPKAISKEQSERDALDIDDKLDVSAEVYASLEETFELTPGRGWLPFRDLVLAHVIEIFKEGFEEHLFEPAFIRALLDYCKLYGAFSEAQSLLAFFAAREEAAKPPRTIQDCISRTANMYSLNCLNDFIMKLFSREFKMRMLAYMVETGKVHVAWLIGRGLEFVRECSSTLAGSDASLALAGEYLIGNVLLASCGLLPIAAETKQIGRGKPRKTRHLCKLSALPSDFQKDLGGRMCTAMSVFCSILCARALAPFFEDHPLETCDRAAWTLSSVSISVRQNLDAISQDPLACRIALAILLADFMLSITVSNSQDDRCSAINRGKAVALASLYTPTDLTTSTTTPDLDLVVASVQCLKIAKKDNETTLILKIIESLRSGVDWHNPTVESSWSPLKLALDLALHYSHKSHAKARAQYAAIAIEIEEQIKTSRRIVEDRQAAKGLRWEEGICEWVTADTPAGMKRAQRPQPSQRIASQPQAPKRVLSTRPSRPVNLPSNSSHEPSKRPELAHNIGFAKYANSQPNSLHGQRQAQPRLFDFNNIFINSSSSHDRHPPQEEKTTARCHTLKRKSPEPLLPIINGTTHRPRASAAARTSLASSNAENTDQDESSLFSTASAASSVSSLSSCASLVLSQGAEPSLPKIWRACANTAKSTRSIGLLDKRSRSRLQTGYEEVDNDDDDDDDSDRDELSITPLHGRHYSKMKRTRLY